MSETQRRIHPVIATAAIAVIIFSALGIAVMTGVMPTSTSKEAPVSIVATGAPATKPAAPPAAEPAPMLEPAAQAVPTPQPAPAAAKPAAAKHAAPAKQVAARQPAPAPAPTGTGLPAQPQVSPTPAPAPVAKAPPLCEECGIIDSIQASEQQGEGTGLGAVAGGVAGGLLGSQIGSGSGKTIATIAGVAAGAYGGHQVEKHVKSAKQWNVRVFMDDGSTRTITESTEPVFRPGDRVRVVDGKLLAR